MGKIIEFELIAKPEKRYQNNFEEEFTMSIKRSGNTNALKTIEPSVNNLGQSTDSYRYGDLDEQITYDISIKSNAHLRKTVTNVTLQEGINVIDFSDGGEFIKAGDINSTDGDNEVNQTDLIALNNNFTNTTETRYDLNKDSVINAIDYSIIISNLNDEGDD